MTRPEPQILQSTSNPTVRRLVRMRDNRTRRRSGRLIVDGWRETKRAMKSGLELTGLFTIEETSESVAENSEYQDVVSEALAAGVWQPVSTAVMSKISYGQSQRGVVAEFIQPQQSLGDLRLPDSPLLLILDRIEKPGNIGAVFRCADAAGIDAVILSDCASDRFNPNAVRSSLGTVFSIPSAADTMENVQQFLLEKQIRPLAARVESSEALWSADWAGAIAIVLGSESMGLGDRWQTLPGTAVAGARSPIAGVQIPMRGDVDSLNISVSAAVIAFEAVRCRRAAVSRE